MNPQSLSILDILKVQFQLRKFISKILGMLCLLHTSSAHSGGIGSSNKILHSALATNAGDEAVLLGLPVCGKLGSELVLMKTICLWLLLVNVVIGKHDLEGQSLLP